MYIKMPKNLSVKYYQENKDYKKSLWKLSKYLWRTKRKKQQYGREHYENRSEDEKQKLVEYRKKNYRMRKNAFL